MCLAIITLYYDMSGIVAADVLLITLHSDSAPTPTVELNTTSAYADSTHAAKRGRLHYRPGPRQMEVRYLWIIYEEVYPGYWDIEDKCNSWFKYRTPICRDPSLGPHAYSTISIILYKLYRFISTRHDKIYIYIYFIEIWHINWS